MTKHIKKHYRGKGHDASNPAILQVGEEPIAPYCNDWKTRESNSEAQSTIQSQIENSMQIDEASDIESVQFDTTICHKPSKR